ncbi:MAG TPA: tetratricopeptide repeat protein [Gemmatimonadales bacterium]|nr:tetratricopeptide repeat protein [Gemmatimonadales bacterium]
MTTEAKAHRAGLPHAVFLQRVTGEPASSAQVQLGQGAFLTLRFVDLLSPDRELPTPDVFRYQWAATERYCAELAGEGTEASHLSGIVRATGDAHRSGDVRLLAPALLAYGLYLEQVSHFEEAEDALQTLIDIGGGRLQPTDAISTWLRLGRTRRMQANFDGALVAYEEAARLANAANEKYSVFLSRIGTCNVHYFRGNIPEAERGWRAILADAAAAGFRTAEAQAHHGLGNLLQRRGLADSSAPHLWRAYELYENEPDQLRVLNDLGIVLLSLGDVEGAEYALNEVARRDRSGENRTNCLIELMQCASFRRDRLRFERLREECLTNLDAMPPNVRADYYFKVGVGLARFGNFVKAETNVRHALEIASAHALHELVFRIERIVDGLRICEAPDELREPTEPIIQSDALREVRASLAAFGC